MSELRQFPVRLAFAMSINKSQGLVSLTWTQKIHSLLMFPPTPCRKTDTVCLWYPRETSRECCSRMISKCSGLLSDASSASCPLWSACDTVHVWYSALLMSDFVTNRQAGETLQDKALWPWPAWRTAVTHSRHVTRGPEHSLVSPGINVSWQKQLCSTRPRRWQRRLWRHSRPRGNCCFQLYDMIWYAEILSAFRNWLGANKVKVKVNMDLYSALSWTHKALRYSMRSQRISQFYLHTLHSSGWRRGVAVECRTRDREVAGSGLSRALWRKNGPSFSHLG